MAMEELIRPDEQNTHLVFYARNNARENAEASPQAVRERTAQAASFTKPGRSRRAADEVDEPMTPW
jgi:hypothetical protein